MNPSALALAVPPHAETVTVTLAILVHSAELQRRSVQASSSTTFLSQSNDRGLEQLRSQYTITATPTRAMDPPRRLNRSGRPPSARQAYKIERAMKTSP